MSTTRRSGRARPEIDRVFSYADLIVFATQTRNLGAGTIVGGGTVSNKHDGGPGLAIAEGGVGYSCIAEQRAVEKIRHGAARTEFLRYGDRVRIEMLGPDGGLDIRAHRPDRGTLPARLSASASAREPDRG